MCTDFSHLTEKTEKSKKSVTFEKFLFHHLFFLNLGNFCSYTFFVLFGTYLYIKYRQNFVGTFYMNTFVHRLNTLRRKSSCGSWRRRMRTCWAAAFGWRRRQLREKNSWRSCRPSWPAQPRSWSSPRTVSPTSRRLSAMCRSVATHWVSTSHGLINYKETKP